MKRPASLFGRCLHTEFVTVLLAVLMTAGGLLLISTAVTDPNYLYKQGFAWLLGASAFVIAFRTDTEKIGDHACAVIFGIYCLILLLTAIFGEGPGNRGWLRFDFLFFDIQPSEVIKAAYIATLARNLRRFRAHSPTFRSIVQLAVHILLPPAFVVAQKDVGNAAVYLLIALAMLLFSGISRRAALVSMASVAVLLPAVWFSLGKLRQERILAGFDPYADPRGYGWQSLISQYAVQSGGLFGKGISNIPISSQIPALHTDMIFAALCEQFGFAGGFCVLALLCGLCLVWLFAAKGKSTELRLLLCGGAAMIAVQTVEVIGMTLGLLPIVGVNLPFFAYGGSALFSVWLLSGLICGRLYRERNNASA